MTIKYRNEKGRTYATITRDSIVEGETISIKPSENENAIFYKYLPSKGLVVDIDLTPYCRSAISGNIKALQSVSPNAVVDMRVISNATRPSVNGQLSDVLYFRNGHSERGLLTRLPYIMVCRNLEGEIAVPIAVQAIDDDYYTVTLGNVSLSFSGRTSQSMLYAAVLKAAHADILNIYDTVNAEARRLPLRIVSRGMNTRVLWWRNEVGGIDTWPFEFLRESTFATTSDVFYSSTNGYTRVNRKSERLHTVETRELDDVTADVVAYILASPEVYVEEGGELVPIDVVTEECRTYSDTELSGVQVSYRKRERE